MRSSAATRGSRSRLLRLLVVLPLLGAVFLLHGVQCIGDDHAGGDAVVTLAAAGAHGTVRAAGDAGPLHMHGAPSADGTVDHLAAYTAPLAAPGGQSSGPVHDVHLGTVCLMLLITAFVLALLGILRRAALWDSGTGPRLHGEQLASVTARRPILARLCVFRI